MKLTIKKWGHSAAIQLPELMLAQLGTKVGDSIELNIQVGAAALRATKPRYKLADLLAQMPRGAPAIYGWDEMPPVGKEIL
jgi:antitoxin component of MazEF toxin-antitoxin module